ncbi:unnamed protein product [Prunus armeniaca]|nr:unnamed protein product [Prunus armeniaca]
MGTRTPPGTTNMIHCSPASGLGGGGGGLDRGGGIAGGALRIESGGNVVLFSVLLSVLAALIAF